MCRKNKTVVDNKKEDVDSPAVVTDSVFITVAVDAHEGWDVDTFDIPVAYLHIEIY